MSMFDLSGRVAIVTGGNGGIGLAMAEAIAGAGASIMLAGRNAKKADAALTQIRGRGAKAMFHETDVADAQACKALVETTAKTFGRVDILVNNAGTTVRRQPQDLAVEDWHKVIETNLTGAFVCAQAAYPHMLKAGGGKVINIGSMLSIFGAAYAVAYGASKGGIVQMTKSLAVAWAKDNIQVNAVLPGWIDTDLTRQARQEVAGLHERVLARTPAQRWGSPSDFAGIALFLASKASDFVTGTAIPIDGGYSSLG
ncbi:MAG TPA: glucose 1-dehydrogenase [Pseudolabrys sp.]|nr:glucose 1-dehydrogenase [Pseudolabrys sp.]